MDVVPEVEFPETDDVVVGFTVQFTHHVNNTTNLTATSGGGMGSGTLLGGAGGNRDSQVHALTSRVYVNLGKVMMT